MAVNVPQVVKGPGPSQQVASSVQDRVKSARQVQMTRMQEAGATERAGMAARSAENQTAMKVRADQQMAAQETAQQILSRELLAKEGAAKLALDTRAQGFSERSTQALIQNNFQEAAEARLERQENTVLQLGMERLRMGQRLQLLTGTLRMGAQEQDRKLKIEEIQRQSVEKRDSAQTTTAMQAENIQSALESAWAAAGDPTRADIFSFNQQATLTPGATTGSFGGPVTGPPKITTTTKASSREYELGDRRVQRFHDVASTALRMARLDDKTSWEEIISGTLPKKLEERLKSGEWTGADVKKLLVFQRELSQFAATHKYNPTDLMAVLKGPGAETPEVFGRSDVEDTALTAWAGSTEMWNSQMDVLLGSIGKSQSKTDTLVTEALSSITDAVIQMKSASDPKVAQQAQAGWNALFGTGLDELDRIRQVGSIDVEAQLKTFFDGRDPREVSLESYNVLEANIKKLGEAREKRSKASEAEIRKMMQSSER